MWMFSIICQLQHDWSILLVIVISWHAAPHCLSLVLFSSHCRLWNRCRRLYVLHIYVHAFMHVRLYVSTISPLSSICWWVFAKLLSLVHLGTEVNWLGFEVKRSKVKVTLRRPALDAAIKLSLQHYIIFNKNCKIIFVNKFPPTLQIFSRKMAKRINLCEVHSFSTSPY